MKPLNEIYKRQFFGRRHKLHWRAPIFCKAVINAINCNSIVDCGCADGDLVKQWLDMGYYAFGMEGSPAAEEFSVIPEERQIWWDLRKPVDDKVLHFDLVVSLEVAEHIEPEYANTYLSNLCYLHNKEKGGVLMSAAPPGCEGHSHVNCQPFKYWIQKMDFRGYNYDPLITNKLKNTLKPWGQKPGIKAFYHHLLFFKYRRQEDAAY